MNASKRRVRPQNEAPDRGHAASAARSRLHRRLYCENLGAKAALKTAQTIRTKLKAIESGRSLGAELFTGSRFRRVIAKRHLLVIFVEADAVRIVRIVHGAQDLEAIVAELDET